MNAYEKNRETRSRPGDARDKPKHTTALRWGTLGSVFFLILAAELATTDAGNGLVRDQDNIMASCTELETPRLIFVRQEMKQCMDWLREIPTCMPSQE